MGTESSYALIMPFGKGGLSSSHEYRSIQKSWEVLCGFELSGEALVDVAAVIIHGRLAGPGGFP